MTSFPIEGTTNRHREQLRGAYLDPSFWPDFQTTLDNFKSLLIKNVEEEIPFTLLRISHSEMTAFYIGLNIAKRVGNFQGRQSDSGTVPDETLRNMFTSIIETDCVSTQIGYDFKAWITEVLKFVDYFKLTLTGAAPYIKANFISHDFPDKPMNELIDIPFDIVYGLVANKWIFKTFKNNIGLIGAGQKLATIRKLMNNKEYQDYLGTEYFTDYIEIPQRGAMDDELLETNIIKGIKSSSCKVFLIGAGVSKLKFYHLVKKHKSCVYIDVGHGIDLIAGYGDNARPYCGSWINYRLKNDPTPEHIDIMGRASRTPMVYLDK